MLGMLEVSPVATMLKCYLIYIQLNYKCCDNKTRLLNYYRPVLVNINKIYRYKLVYWLTSKHLRCKNAQHMCSYITYYVI